MKVNVISETTLFPEESGGSYTAFINSIQLLESQNVDVIRNSLRQADVTHIHSIGPYALYKLYTSKRTVITSHMLPDTFIGNFKGGKSLQGVIKSYLRFFYNKADIIVSLNNESKQDLIRMGVKTKIMSLPNPINTTVFKKDKKLREKGRAELGITSDEKVVVGAGQLISRKGIKDFIAVARAFPDITFLWAGGKTFKLLNAETNEEKKLLQVLPKNVRVLGQMSYADMPKLFNLADIFFFPSYQETQGMVIIEAAACGLPLVLRDLPAYKTLYKDYYSACKTNDDFVEAIKKLSTSKENYKNAIAQSEKVTEMYTFEELGEKLLTIYRQLD